MRKMDKIGNHGFSLIELVIVIAIMVILGGAAFTGLSLLTSRPVDECAKKIQIALEGNRNTTMGKLSSSISFSADASGVWAEETINGSSTGKTLIGQNGVTVQYVLKKAGDTSETVVTLGSVPLVITFDRATGSQNYQADGVSYVSEIRVSRGDRELIVTVDRLTGRVDLE